MVVVESHYIEPNNNKDILETPTEMGKDETRKNVEDVEEGEISDSASVEEISEEDFIKQDATEASNGSDLMDSNPIEADTRVWTMRDLYKYPGFRGYASGLYNLAWAQAVQNKPLNDIFVMDVDSEDSAKRSSSSAYVNNCKEDNSNAMEVDSVVIVDSGDEIDPTEKEEGELEEGEIDLDSEHLENNAHEAKGGVFNFGSVDVGESETDSMCNDLDIKVKSIREALASVTVMDAEKSLEEVCCRLNNTLESFQRVILNISLTTTVDLSQLFFTALRVVNSVFWSLNRNQKEQKKEIFLRLISSIKNCDPHILSPVHELMNEIDVMISSINSLDVLPTTKAAHKEVGARNIDGFHEKDSYNAADNACNGLAFAKLPSKSVPAMSMAHTNPITSSENFRPGIYGSKSRGILLPLLDLHKDHDADSLPSPTRDSSSCFSFLKLLAARDGTVESGSATAKEMLDREASRPHRYETDAFKALSTYQQKFGGNSFSINDRLPSPTPSEEFDDRDDDPLGEVSSSVAGNLRTSSAPMMVHPLVPSSIPVSSSIIQGPILSKTVTPPASGFMPTIKASAKSRDPRLRASNLDFGGLNLKQRPLSVTNNSPKVEPRDQLSSRKQKTLEDSNLDGPELKRQRSILGNSSVTYDVTTPAVGWLEDSGSHGHHLNKNLLVENAQGDSGKPINVSNCTATKAPNICNELGTVTSSGSTASLPALLKDIVVNPTMLLNLIKLGQQQKLVADSQQMSDPSKFMVHSLDTNSIPGAYPLASVAPFKASGILHTPRGALHVNSQAVSMSPQDDLGKVRMKPRDPRRVLHSNILQKSGSLSNEQSKTSLSPVSSKQQGSKDNLNEKRHEVQADKKPLTSQSVGPDIARQFTKNLRNLADLVSVSSISTSAAIVPQTLCCEQSAVKGDQKVVVSKSEDQNSGTSSIPETAVVGPFRSRNMWSDVEHLFEGYSNHQKTAIQRERTRRMEEQKKMFAARKLCLVLDLDHTLLNSAKFVEVDPVHDEILRKKEEQDREKPYKHLFCFPHMGMWTKLRPGIWNFLEKAGKLFELHLYTMGNKVYATEMAKVLDPNGVLFAGRVISRGDEGDPSDGDERVPKSKDLEGVLGMESSVVIIDDSVRVWPHNKMNLIVVERYMYFPCSRRQFGLLGPSLLEIDHDERPEEGTLASCLAVIERIHQNFFSHHSLDEADIRNILAEEQRRILSGCRIVFSRVFPVGEANPHLHPLWQTAEQFGAVCTSHIDEQVTHVVANSLGTDKVNWALSSGKFVVHPGWVEASALLYRRVNEQDFAIKP